MNFRKSKPLITFLLGFILALGLLSLAPLAFAYPGVVTGVPDGDTAYVDGKKIRLERIDAPELDQPGGVEARDFLAGLILGKRVEVLPAKRKDFYGRVLAGMLLDGVSVQAAMVESGHAWVYTKYCRRCPELKALEAKARAAGAGLWGQPGAIAPWCWRHPEKECR